MGKSPPQPRCVRILNGSGTNQGNSLTDHGIGIPLDEHKNIFDAFHQIKRPNNAGGAGLGLAICKGLIEAHGGNIWIQETNSSGTTISFSLPISLPS